LDEQIGVDTNQQGGLIMEKHQGFVFSVGEIIKELVKAGKLPEMANHEVMVSAQRELDQYRPLGVKDNIKFEVG